MAIKIKNELKADFETGKQATEEKFINLIDSAYNKAEDSVLIGPLGQTGTVGLWISSNIPASPTANGEKGEISVNEDNIFICIDSNSWIKFQGATSF